MKARARSAALLGLAFAFVCLVTFFLSGVPFLQRGVWAASCFLCCLCSFFVGVGLGPTIIPDDANPKEAPDKDAIQPDKSPMRTAMMVGVLESIKGLVARSEDHEKRIKEMESRVTETALAAGLKLRRRDMGAPEPPAQS